MLSSSWCTAAPCPSAWAMPSSMSSCRQVIYCLLHINCLCISEAFCHPAAVYQQCHQVSQAAGKSSLIFCISNPILAAVYQHGQLRQVCKVACKSSVAVSRPKPVCHTLERERLYSFHIKFLCCCKDNVQAVKPILSCWLLLDACIFSLYRPLHKQAWVTNVHG